MATTGAGFDQEESGELEIVDIFGRSIQMAQMFTAN